MQRHIDLTMEQCEGNHTHPVHGRTPLMFPGTGSHALTRMWGHKNPYDGSDISVANEYILICGHTGTHVDAPYHVDAKSRLTVEKLPIERTMGTAVWLDLSAVCSADVVLGPEELRAAEIAGGEPIRLGDIVLLHTGWYSLDRPVPDYIQHSPSVSKEGAEWLRGKGIVALGMDLPSPDGHAARSLPVHMNFLKPKSLGLAESEYILIYENLVNIHAIPSRRFYFSGLPIPFRGATGSPVRATATCEMA